jgi:hypothetical protein
MPLSAIAPPPQTTKPNHPDWVQRQAISSTSTLMKVNAIAFISNPSSLCEKRIKRLQDREPALIF